MTENPGNYWLVTESGARRKAIVTDDALLLIHQEAIYSPFSEYRGERWWQPPEFHEGWSLVPRV